MDASWAPALREYYRSPAVRGRIAEYCGGRPQEPSSFSCWGLAGYGGARGLGEPDGGPTPCPNADLDRLFADGADVCRSLADLGGTLLQLDVDYVDPRDPGEPYRKPEVVLRRLVPVRRVLSEVFAGYGMCPRVVLTGRGYHFTVRAPSGSAFQSSLLEIGAIGESMEAKLPRHGLESELVRRLARAHEGAGLVLQHIAHRALHLLRGQTEVETTLADLPPPGGAPFVCLDLTAYGDPLFERYCRCAFSANQKAGAQGAAFERPYLFTLPCDGEDVRQLLDLRESGLGAAAWAATAPTAIPDVNEATHLFEEYRRGAVGRFHAEFQRGPRVPPAQWPFTYDRLTDQDLPACVRTPLDHPNPLLLRPACLRSVTLGLWGLGWHPRSIAGIVASRFVQDHGWSPSFERYDAASRAQFYVRLFCAALADGLDSPERFTCETQRARGLCTPGHCTESERGLFTLASAALQEKEEP